MSKKADGDEPIGRLRYYGVLFHFLVLFQDYNDVIHIICIRNSRIPFFKIHQAAFSGYHTDYNRGLNLFKAEWPTALILHVQDDDNIRYVSSHVNHIVYKLTEYMHMPCHAEKNTLVLKLICNKEMYEYKSSNRSIML